MFFLVFIAFKVLFPFLRPPLPTSLRPLHVLISVQMRVECYQPFGGAFADCLLFFRSIIKAGIAAVLLMRVHAESYQDSDAAKKKNEHRIDFAALQSVGLKALQLCRQTQIISQCLVNLLLFGEFSLIFRYGFTVLGYVGVVHFFVKFG